MLTLDRRAPSLDDFLDELAATIEIAASVEIPHAPSIDHVGPRPFPGPQSLAYLSLADELFYGGAGGGGKTTLELIAAANNHQSTTLFRREQRQFDGPEGIIAAAKRLLGSFGRVTDDGVHDLPGGREIEFASMAKADDWEKRKGRAADLMCFDELPEFLELQYRSVIAWLRTSVPGQRTRVIATGNPPTSAEGEWVIQYWAPWLDEHHPNPAKPGELRWFVHVDDKDIEVPTSDFYEYAIAGPDGVPRIEKIKPRSRTFIRALVDDNPLMMASGYDQVLNSLPEPLRSQMRHGNFRASATDHQWQVIPTQWVRDAQARWTPERPTIEVPNPKTPGVIEVPMPMSALGADISRGGKDATTLAPRYGHWFAPVEKHAGKSVPDGPHAANLIFQAVGGNKDVPVHIDVIGAGSSAYDQAILLGLKAIPLNGSEGTKARDKSQKMGFFNKRAWFYWMMRDALDPANGMHIALPPGQEVLADLCSARWHPTKRGIQVELKEDIIARIGRSPDVGEAIIYANAEVVPFTHLAAGGPVSVGDGPSAWNFGA